MAMKRTVTAEEFSKLIPQLQAEYKKEGETYTLDLTDYEDPVKLKSAKDHEKEQRKLAEQKARELQTQLETLTEERDNMLKGSIPKADAEKLEKSYKDKMDKLKADLEGQLTAANGSLQTLLVDNVAQSLASEISTAPAVLMPHIKGRLKAEKGADGKFVTKVLDKDGAPSALSVEDLKQEFILHPDFKAIITGSKASGGGAGGGGSGGGAAGGKVNWSGSPKEIAASLKGKAEQNATRVSG